MAMDLDEPFDAKAVAEKGEAALRRLRDADPAFYLSPFADLTAAAQEASKHLYSSLVPFSLVQPPSLSNLLAGPAFDAKQIWSYIELLSRPLIPHMCRQLRRLEQHPPSQPPPHPKSKTADAEEEQSEEEDGKGDELKELDDIDDEEESEKEEEEDTERLEGRTGNMVEDKFLKIKEMKEFMEKGEEEEYGGGAKQGKKETENWMEEESDEEDEEDLGEDEDKGSKDEEDDNEHFVLEDLDDDEEEDDADGGIIDS